MSLSRLGLLSVSCAILTLGLSGIARAQSAEYGSMLTIDPTIALNGFAILAGGIVLLFNGFRSRP
jgi:hypothetical protein